MTEQYRRRILPRKLGELAGAVNRWIVVAWFLLCPLIGVIAHQLAQQDYDDELDRTRQIQANVVKGMELHLDELMGRADYVLMLMKSSYETTGAISPAASALLSSSAYSLFASQAAILDPLGNFVFSFVPRTAGVNLADREHFRMHVARDNGKLFIGPVVTGRVSGRPSFHFSRRINRPDGSFGGVVSLAVATDYLDELFQQMPLQKTNYLLVGPDGIIRAASGDNRELLGRSLADGPLFQAIRKNPQLGDYFARTLYFQERRLVTYRISERYGMISLVSQLETDVFQRFYERRKLYYGVAGLISAILLFTMILLLRASRRQAELRLSLQAAMERAEYYLDMAGALIVALDREGHVTMLNHRGCEILGYKEDELVGKDWFAAVLPAENRDYAQMRFRQAMNGGYLPQRRLSDMEVITRDGSRRTISWMNNVLTNPQGEIVGTISSGSDVTERRRLEAELLRLASIDSLTGLSNRRTVLAAGQQEFQQFKRYQRPLSLGLMDVDHFKHINDTYGHAAGDEVLRRLAQVCRESLRAVDHCGRFGGEEFVFILPETPADKAWVTAERLWLELAALSVEVPAGKVSLTVSIGLVSAEAADTCIEDLVRLADANMYVAKQRGRNQVVQGRTLSGETV